MHVLATAGHVDHGKSTLVQALTGIDPDRLVEEKARGLTIDLGFAWTTLPSGRPLAFVDVPGHVRFLKNMLAGVGAVDACLFVVAATEGWKPQSEEHLRILDLLGVGGGVVALTKAALVDGERLAEVAADVRRRLDGSVLAGADVVATDVPTGAGLDELRAALEGLLAVTPASVDRGRPRLWVDRCFPAAGAGTVVTGTLAGGRLTVGDELALVPGPGPGHRPLAVRVRTLQSHREDRSEVGPGHRVAIGLAATGHDRLDRRKVQRGQALVRPGQWAPTTVVDATLEVLPAAPVAVGRRGAYQAYVGSGEHAVSLRVLGSPAVEPGGAGLVRLHLPVPLPLLPGDRYVLRDAGRSATVGGGEVLDVAPYLPAARARPDRSVERVVAERRWVEADLLERLTGERRAPDLGGWVVDPTALAEDRRRLLAATDAAGALGLDLSVLDERDRAVLRDLADRGEVSVGDGRARRGEMAVDLRAHPFVRALEAAPFAPPDAAAFGVDRTELRQLVAAGLVVERDGLHFAASAVSEGSRLVAELLAGSPEGVTASAVRERLGTSRKFALPFLSLLDAEGITRRRGDVRVAGPRLPVAAPDTGRLDPAGRGVGGD